jgi:hypothetical protein
VTVNPQLKATVQGLRSLHPRRTEQDWLRRAFEVNREAGPLDEVEDRMAAWLHERIVAAQGSQALTTKVREFVSEPSGLTPELEQVARDKVRQGITHERAVELGYESLDDMRRQVADLG